MSPKSTYWWRLYFIPIPAKNWKLFQWKSKRMGRWWRRMGWWSRTRRMSSDQFSNLIWNLYFPWQNVLTWSVPSDLMFKIYTSLDKITWCNASFDEMIWSVPSDLMLKICISLDNYHHMKQRWRTRNILAATWPPSTSFEMMYKIYTFLCNLHLYMKYTYVHQNIKVGIFHSVQSNLETQTCP